MDANEKANNTQTVLQSVTPTFMPTDGEVMTLMIDYVLAARGEDTPVVVDASATYFGTPLQETSLVTGADAVIAGPRFADWLAAR